MYQSGRRGICGIGIAILTILLAMACGPRDTPTQHPVSAVPPTRLPQSQATPAPPVVSPLGNLGADEIAASQLGPNLRFARIGIEDGLSNSAVWHILQDSEGFMWFGTQDGLNRYDGNSFAVYRHDPNDPQSLTDDYISSIYEDRSGVLWIGTQQGWLEKYDREQDRFTPFHIGSWITAVYEDRAGVLWVGAQAGLYRFDREAEQATLITSERGWVEVIYEDRAGQLWFGTEDGWLSTLDRSSSQFVDYAIAAPPTSILEDHTGTLWVGTYHGGLGQFDPESKQFTYYQHDPDDPFSLSDSKNVVFSISEDRAGALWLGTSNGLSRFDRATRRFTHYEHDSSDPLSLSNNVITSVFQDRSGVLWTGNEWGGINKLAAGAGQFGHIRHITDEPNSLSANIVTSMVQDQEGGLWIGTVAGLDRLDRKTGQWKHYLHDPDDAGSLANDLVRSVYVDRSGELWVGTRDGLDRYNRETDRFIHYDESPVVMWMHEGPSDTLWLATKSGLFQLDRDTDRLTHEKAAASWMVMVLEDRSGVVWIGTSGDGLYRYDPADDTWRHFLHDSDDVHSLSHNFVESIHEDEMGTLWLGTRGGLDRFDQETEIFAHYRVQDGLVDDSIVGMLQDRQRNLWLATQGGLSRFAPQTETFKNYYASDGLQGNSFWRNAYYGSPDGELFFGGENGLSAFYPERITDNPHPPPVVITAFSLFGKVVRTNLNPNERINLDHQDGFVSFDFAALDYHNPEKNQYAYKLEGVDEDWVYSGTRRHADYPNLAPGEYVFRVKGSNNDGVWNEEGAAVHITIEPPFWGTWWFRSGIVVILIATAIAVYRLRVRSVEARSHELENQVAERTAELQQEIEQREQIEEALRESEREQAVAEERSRLARELHDAVTQTLFSASLIAEVLPRMWEMNQERGRQQLEEVRTLTRGALAEMRTLLLELRPEAIVKAKMEDLLRQLARVMMGRTGVPVDVTIEGECRLPSEVQVALYRIAQEALNNAAKHADAGHVCVCLRCLPARVTEDEGPRTDDGPATTDGSGVIVELSVSDDGRGFDPGEVPPGRLGLGILRERTAAIGATLEIESTPDHGTKVVAVWATEGEGPQTTDDSQMKRAAT